MDSQVPAAQLKHLESALDRLREVTAYDYAQWVVESPKSRDLEVVSSRYPRGGDCYAIAHRPGVIGQVFRRERPIFIPDTRVHPLYDAYDNGVKWELTMPLFRGGGLAAVLNLEGSVDVIIDVASWRRLQDILVAETGWQLPESTPQPGEAWMVKTARAEVRNGSSAASAEAALRLGRSAAASGSWILVVGVLDLPARSAYPKVADVLAAGAALGGCVRGGHYRLDLLPLELSDWSSLEEVDWWSAVEGRYDFVLVARPV